MTSSARHFLSGFLLCTAALLAGGALSSCDSFIFEDPKEDCTVHYCLTLKYTENILGTDAFGSQVSDVNIALYDKSGSLAYTKSVRRNLSVDNDFSIEMDVRPDVYDVIAWCEGPAIIGEGENFSFSGLNRGDNLTSSSAFFIPQEKDGSLYFNKNLKKLFYGYLHNVKFEDSNGTVEIEPVYLTQDSKHISVQLQNMNGEPIDPKQLSFEIEARNSVLDWKNLPVADAPKFYYEPWSVASVITQKSRADITDEEIPSGVLADFTVSRLMADRELYLSVKLKDTGREILNFKLMEAFLSVYDRYSWASSPQMYLDRLDEYSLVFFLDEGYSWMRSKIYINGWRVLPPQHGTV